MRAGLALLLLLPLAAHAQLFGSAPVPEGRDDAAEAAVALPQYPKPENYLPFEVNATTSFLFFVDANSLSIGADNVIRYSLIAKSSEGVLNVSYEGMRCRDRRYRVYAVGQSDHTWAEVRKSRWEPIRTKSRSAQRAALYSDYFCTSTGNIVSAEEGVRALKSGGNPRAKATAY